MFCVKCLHPDTNVVNSRPHKKYPGVWRRRKCPQCGHLFTTEEHPKFTDSYTIHSIHTEVTQGFNPGKLTISVAAAFGHDMDHGKEVAWSLTETIMALLSKRIPSGDCSTDDLSRLVHEVIMRYDARAGAQYALQHGVSRPTARRKKA